MCNSEALIKKSFDFIHNGVMTVWIIEFDSKITWVFGNKMHCEQYTKFLKRQRTGRIWRSVIKDIKKVWLKMKKKNCIATLKRWERNLVEAIMKFWVMETLILACFRQSHPSHCCFLFRGKEQCCWLMSWPLSEHNYEMPPGPLPVEGLEIQMYYLGMSYSIKIEEHFSRKASAVDT